MTETSKGHKQKSMFSELKELDERVSLYLSIAATKESTYGHFRPHMKALELSCHGLFWISGLSIGLWLSLDPVKQAFFFNMLIAQILDIALVFLLKTSIARSRPSNNKSDMFMTWSADKMSCPSGHTSRAILLMFLLISSSPNMILLHPIIILWSLSTCLSRVMLGRHYFGDVLIGVILGYVEYNIMDYIWASPETAKWYFGFFNDAGLADEL